MLENTNDLMVVLCTFANVEDAGFAAHTLVAEQLCACVNILPHMRSIYRWQGEIANSVESLCLLKTTKERYPALKARLRELHSYEVPEIVALQAVDVADSYLSWVVNEVNQTQGGATVEKAQEGAQQKAEAASETSTT